MPVRSGRRRGGSEERRGRRPHPSPSRAERNERQTRAAGEELGCFNRRPQGQDSSESDGEQTVPPPKRQKVQDSLSSAPTSTHLSGTTTAAPRPTSCNTQSRESDYEDGQSQGSRSSAGGSLVNSSSSISSGRDIDQDNRSSSPSLSGSPLASLDSESDSPDSPKQGGKVKEGVVLKPGGAARGNDSGSVECRDTEGVKEADTSVLKSPSSLCPLTESSSGRKSYYSVDHKIAPKTEFASVVGEETMHTGSRSNVIPKMVSQCGGKMVVGGAEYPHGNPNVSHASSSALPPPPALKPLEAGQSVTGEVKMEKIEKCDKAPPSLLPQTTSLSQQAPPPRHPHHYSPTSWSGGAVSTCPGNWGYTRYPGVHHAPVQQQQLPSVYNPPSSNRHSSHPSYLPHPHPPHPHREYLPRYSSPAERDRAARDIAIKDSSGGSGAHNSANIGSDYVTPVPGQNRAPGRDGTSGSREFRPGFRERDAMRDFSLQNQNQQHVAQSRDFGPGGASGTGGAGGCHPRDKDGRWVEYSGQIREVGSSSNPSNLNQVNVSTSSSSLPSNSPQNSSATPNKDFQSGAEQVGQGHQVPATGSDPPPTAHFLREYPPPETKDYPSAGAQPSPAPHPGPSREFPSPTKLASNMGRDFAERTAVPHPHYLVQPGLTVQSRERERERERDSSATSSIYHNRNHPPSLSPSSSSSTHGLQPPASYPPSHSQQPLPPSTLPPSQTRPGQYPSSNQSPPTTLSPLPSPSTNQMGGFPPFPSTSVPSVSGAVTSCLSGCRPAPYHGTLNSHTSFAGAYHGNSNHSSTVAPSNPNSNNSVNSHMQLHSPTPSKIQSHPGNPVAPPSNAPTGAEGQSESSTCSLPQPVIKEEPIEEREETESPPTVLRSPSPEPKAIDIPIHASQSARFHRVLDRGSGSSCARTDVLFIPLDGSKLWKKRNEAIERARREVEQKARDLREKERERDRERERERERERDLERHLQQKDSNPGTVPRQGSSLFFSPSSSLLLDPSSSSSSPCINHSHHPAHHPAHSIHPSHAHALHPSLSHAIPPSLLLPSVGGLGPYLGPDTPALRTLSEYARPHAMSPLGPANRAPPHFHPHPHHHPHAHPHVHPSLFLPQFQNPALAHPHHLPADAATAAAILGFLYGTGLEAGHGHPGAGPVAGPGPGGMAGLGAGIGGMGFSHSVMAHRERVKAGFDFKSEFDSHTHSHSHSLLLGSGASGGAPASEVGLYGTPPPPAPPSQALATVARNPSAVPQPLSTPPTSTLLPPSLPSHAPPTVNPVGPAPPPPPPAPPPPPPAPTASSLHPAPSHPTHTAQPPAHEGYSAPSRTPPSTERARSVEREREKEREKAPPSGERERGAPATPAGGGTSGGGGASGGGGGAGESLGRLQMLNVTPHHHQHSHIHSHLHLHQQDTAPSSVHPLIDPLATGAPLPRLPYPGSIITHPLTESDVLRQQLFGAPFRDLPPHSSMHHQNTELQIQRLALEQQWIHHHHHSLTQEEYYSHLKKESDKAL